MVVHVTTEFGTSMKPWPNANENASIEPFWTVVSGRCTGVWRDVIVSIGTIGGNSDLNADLSLRHRGQGSEANYGNRRYQ
jgi:hypothetical protein